MFVVLALAGCATTVRYFPYTSQKLPPKPSDYPVMIFAQGQHPTASQSYVVIGKVNVSGHVSDGLTPDDLMNKARAIARKKGADGIINVKTQNFDYKGIYEVPGHVSYHAVGFAGRHRDVVYVEHYHPTRYIPYSDTLLSLEGELIVFNR
jgi:hypothetical protein